MHKKFSHRRREVARMKVEDNKCDCIFPDDHCDMCKVKTSRKGGYAAEAIVATLVLIFLICVLK